MTRIQLVFDHQSNNHQVFEEINNAGWMCKYLELCSVIIKE